jgi:1-acyl-sn-glycerol-3-phosphate acyltransferase
MARSKPVRKKESRKSAAKKKPNKPAPRKTAYRPEPADPGLLSFVEGLLPAFLDEIEEEVDERLARIPTKLNEFGYDPWGLDIRSVRSALIFSTVLYRYYFRVEVFGIDRLPPDRVLVIANHAGQIALDAAMIGTATVLEAEPPRILRGMGEYWLPTLPFFSEAMVRTGSVVGTPKNCRDLLAEGEAVIAFPEGVRGMNKLFSERYELQRFGYGFMRLALATDTPIIPVAVVGSEEQAPGLANLKTVARILGMPAFPITPTFPLLGPLGMLPLPVKYRIYFGKPMYFRGDPDDEDAHVKRKVAKVRAEIQKMLDRGVAERSSIFF